MHPCLGLNYSSESVTVENVDNVYTDGEFRLRLPAGWRLQAMPKMNWTQVKHFYSPFFF